MAMPSLSFVIHYYCYTSNHCYYCPEHLHRQQTQYRCKCSSSLTTISSAATTTTNDELNSIDDDDDENDEERNRLLLHKRFSSLRSIGVDYGLTRTGIAITTGGYQPRPLTIVSGLNNTQLATSIVNYVLSERATNIVLGLPLHKNGTASEQSSITRLFGLELLKEVRKRCGPNVHVNLWDERYTSKEAAARIAAEAMARNRRIPSASDLSGELDADAACIILEHYYKDMGLDAEQMVFEDESMERECEMIYKTNVEMEERLRVERMEERERNVNARREMMERDRALEEENVDGGNKKRKKKKRKR